MSDTPAPVPATQTKPSTRWEKLESWLASVDRVLVEHARVNTQAQAVLRG